MRRAAIVGVGESPYSRGDPPAAPGVELQLQAIDRAAADAGVPVRDLDGIVLPDVSAFEPDTLAGTLGLRDPRFTARVDLGGASTVAALGLARLAVLDGAAKRVLVATGALGFSRQRARDPSVMRTRLSITRSPIIRDHYLPHGATAPAIWYALLARRYMHEYGLTSEQLGAVALAARRHAQLNDRAVMRDRPLTLEAYLASPMICDPFRLFDCCLETDSFAAVVVAAEDRAADCRAPVEILSVAQARPTPPDDLASQADFDDNGVARAARRGLGAAGVCPGDLHFAQIYDCFTFEVIQQLEALGVCGRGEGGAFAEGGRIELGGDLPVNTHGGLLSEAHVMGMNHVIEAVRQLRSDAGARQVRGAEVGVVTGWGDFGDGAVAVLGQWR